MGPARSLDRVGRRGRDPLLADPRDGREISRSRPTDGAITAVDRSADGTLLAIGTGGSLLAGDNWAQIVTGPGAQPSLLLIDTADGRVLDRIETAGGIAALRFDRDGRRVYAGTADSTVVAFSIVPGPEGGPRLARDPSPRWELRGAVPVESDARPSATSSVLGEIRSIDLDASGHPLRSTQAESSDRTYNPNLYLRGNPIALTSSATTVPPTDGDFSLLRSDGTSETVLATTTVPYGHDEEPMVERSAVGEFFEVLIWAVGKAPPKDPQRTATDATYAIPLGAWGGGCLADLNGDGNVDAADLAALLGAWGR